MIEPIIKELEKIHNGKVAKCLFIKLPSKKNVKEHKDLGNYFNAIKRHHIAIETNKETFFYINNEKKNMEVGDCWEINNMRSHYVKNNGETDRIHLLIDILPNDLFAKS
jgi:aspartyl/asparaginyl beta-hydroxylase (cupin superfamily)